MSSAAPGGQAPTTDSATRCDHNVGRVGLLVTALLLGGLAAAGWWRIHLGVDFTDEGAYLSTPLRFALGDVPFRDDSANGLRWSDVFLWPVFEVWPEMTLVQFRALGLAAVLAVAACLVALLGRHVPAPVLMLACIPAVLGRMYIWSLGYNQASTSFLTLGCCIWLLGCTRSSRRASLALGIGGGAAMFIGVASYATLAPALVVPLVVLLATARRRPRPQACWATAAALGTVVLLLAVAAITLSAKNLTGDWLRSVHLVVIGQEADKPFGTRFSTVLRQSRHFFPYTALFGGLLALACGLAPRGHSLRPRLRAAAACALAGGGTLAVLSFAPSPEHWYWGKHFLSLLVISLGLGFLVAAAALWLIRRRYLVRCGRGWPLVFWGLLAVVLICTGLHCVSSTGGVSRVTYSMMPIMALGTAALLWTGRVGNADAAAVTGRRAHWHAACVAAAIAPFAIHAALPRQARPYRDAPAAELTATFSGGALAGIHSTPSRVRIVNHLLDELANRVKAGEFLLAYDEIPLVYFLTDTRPANEFAFTNKLLSVERRARAVAAVQRKGRAPRYCVRCVIHTSQLGWPVVRNTIPYSPDPGFDPYHAFVDANYTPVATVWPFQIWKRNDLLTPDQPERPWRYAWIEPEHWLKPRSPPSPLRIEIEGNPEHFEFTVQEEAGRSFLRVRLAKDIRPPMGQRLRFRVRPNARDVAGRSVRLTCNVRPAGPRSCWVFVEDRSEDTLAQHRYDLFAGKPPCADIDTLIQEKTREVSLGIEFRPQRGSRQVEIGQLRIGIR